MKIDAASKQATRTLAVLLGLREAPAAEAKHVTLLLQGGEHGGQRIVSKA